MSTVAEIFARVQLPVLALIAAGVLLQRSKGLELATLVRLNLYLFVPAFLFARVADSRMPWLAVGKIGAAILLCMALIGLPVWWVLRRRRATPDTMAVLVIGGLFFNAGNFGLPVVHLAFGPRGDETQALVIMFINTTLFFAGYVLVAVSRGHSVASGAQGYFKLPMVYALCAGVAVRVSGIKLWTWVDIPVRMAADGLVPIALVTLGAQLGTAPRWPRWRLVGPALVIKLLLMPAVMAGVVWALGLWPMPGAVLILASAAPTAVNTLLLALEVGGDAETSADVVFWTTLASTVTVTVVLVILSRLTAP